ncbi:MAG: FKBP-type peptidyl-prolyl cis-trans isomerase [Gammaproteobacteria bacterium]|nr:FKBP-type peptidyl-prolyl cis-trans isomerase [Gammaproteobacteria bacterium]MDE0249355.1 FKBP-type peptidyl-prolyl cis-trans isomerase [Gammaproteobacteria bacterium]
MGGTSSRRRGVLGSAAAAVLLLAAAGCGSAGTPFEALARDPTEVTYAASLGVNLDEMTRSPTGLYYQTLTEGRGAEVAAAGDSLLVHYTGWTRNGARFDRSPDDRPLMVVLGEGTVIPGFEEGLEGMRLGEERLLVIPHELAYGSRRIGDIPPYAILVFRIELVGLEKAQAS